jgi:hypothetical protein
MQEAVVSGALINASYHALLFASASVKLAYGQSRTGQRFFLGPAWHCLRSRPLGDLKSDTLHWNRGAFTGWQEAVNQSLTNRHARSSNDPARPPSRVETAPPAATRTSGSSGLIAASDKTHKDVFINIMSESTRDRDVIRLLIVRFRFSADFASAGANVS